MGWTRAAVAATVVVGTAVGAISTSAAQAKDARAWAGSPHSLTVGYRTRADLEDALRGLPARVVRRLSPLHAAELSTAGSAASLASALVGLPGIAFAEPLAARDRREEPGLVFGARAGPEWQYRAVEADAVPDAVLRAAASVTIARFMRALTSSTAPSPATSRAASNAR